MRRVEHIAPRPAAHLSDDGGRAGPGVREDDAKVVRNICARQIASLLRPPVQFGSLGRRRAVRSTACRARVRKGSAMCAMFQPFVLGEMWGWHTRRQKTCANTMS